MTALSLAQRTPKPNTTEQLPLDQFDHILVSYSGGKDSLACLLRLLDLGVPNAGEPVVFSPTSHDRQRI